MNPVSKQGNIPKTQDRGKVFLVEDDENIRKLLAINFRKAGFEFESADNGLKILERLEPPRPDLIILDMMLPFKRGDDVLEEIRSRQDLHRIPVFFLTAKTEEEDILHGLALGADDYIKKPFSPKELVARAKNAISKSRRLENEEAERDRLIELGDVRLDTEKIEAFIGDRPMKLTLSEFRLMELLCRKPGVPFRRGRIIDAIRGEEHAVTERAVDVLVFGLRKKIAASACEIKNVRGVGYRILPP